MSERKVLNKYYPPDFDPSAIPRLRREKKNVPFNIRIMAPFNMRCNTCGVYIYKGKKFNSRKEDVENEDYLGLRIFRFYIKCPQCVSEIAFKTDLKRTDYALEAGATRLFEAERMAQEMAERERKEKEEEELNNPMKVLENRTKASRNEIEQIDMLEELREMNSRQANIDHEKMLELHKEYEEQLRKLQEEQEEKEIRAIFGQKEGKSVKRIQDDSDSEEEPVTKKLAVSHDSKPTDVLSSEDSSNKNTKTDKKESWQKSIGGFSSKKNLMTLVKKKAPSTTNTSKPQSDKLPNTDSTNQEKITPNRSTNKTEAVDKCDGASTSSKNSDHTNTGNSNSECQSDIPDSKPAVSGLSMLGRYSDSDSDSASN